MREMNITQADVTGLTEKLTALDLTAGERALLGQIIDAASDDEVSGFAMNDPFQNLLGVAMRFTGTEFGAPTSFAESGKKGEVFTSFAESGKKAEFR
jgi:hypothetical protein